MKPITIPLTVEARLQGDYDATYMQDRVIARLFVGGCETGIYSIAALDPDLITNRYQEQRLIEQATPPLVANMVGSIGDAAHKGEQIVRLQHELEDARVELAKLQGYVHRVRWWQLRRLYDAWKTR